MTPSPPPPRDEASNPPPTELTYGPAVTVSSSSQASVSAAGTATPSTSADVAWTGVAASPGMNSPSPPQGAEEVLEADDFSNLENDSSFGDDDAQSDRTSLASGITKYRQENGRRYHAYRDGAYLLPNDEKEQDRMDLHHHIFNLIENGKMYRAPIQNPGRVLDIGCGTGIWAMDFADAHPEAHVIGMDLSPIQPSWVPPNLEFIVDDCEDDWTGSRYDYIHIRMLSGAIKDWTRLLAQSFANLNPGGWLEVTEFEIDVHSDNDTPEQSPNIKFWCIQLAYAAQKIGRRFDVAVNLNEWMVKAGFVDIDVEIKKIPSTPWPRDKRLKEIGLYQQQNMLDSSTSYGQAHFTRVLGWSNEEYAVLSAQVRNELRDPHAWLYSWYYVVCGRKPL